MGWETWGFSNASWGGMKYFARGNMTSCEVTLKGFPREYIKGVRFWKESCSLFHEKDDTSFAIIIYMK